MAADRAKGFRCRAHGLRAGFTLLELLIAIAVMSIASTVFISLFSSAQDLSRTSLTRATATRLAQDQLSALLRNPQAFHWQVPQQPGADLFRIQEFEDDPLAGSVAAVPASMPVNRRAFEYQTNYHEKYRWMAFGRLPQEAAQYYEVTVMVYWTQGNRTESVALTSSVPRFAAGGAA